MTSATITDASVDHIICEELKLNIKLSYQELVHAKKFYYKKDIKEAKKEFKALLYVYEYFTGEQIALDLKKELKCS